MRSKVLLIGSYFLLVGACLAFGQAPQIHFIRSKTFSRDGITTIHPGHSFELSGEGFSKKKTHVTVEIIHVQAQTGPGGVPLEPRLVVVARIRPISASEKLLKLKMPQGLSSGMREVRVLVQEKGASGRMQFRVGNKL